MPDLISVVSHVDEVSNELRVAYLKNTLDSSCSAAYLQDGDCAADADDGSDEEGIDRATILSEHCRLFFR